MSTKTAPNTKLAYEVLDHIDAHPKLWRQDMYIGETDCGTAACFAGWACLLSGEKPWYQFAPDPSKRLGWTTANLAAKHGGDSMAVSYRAQELLRASRYLCDVEGGDEDDERDLFNEWNDREDLGRYVEEIFGPRPDGAA